MKKRFAGAFIIVAGIVAGACVPPASLGPPSTPPAIQREFRAAWERNYAHLLDWWVKENTHRRHIWVGNFTSRSDTVVGPQRWRATEILHQIQLTRD